MRLTTRWGAAAVAAITGLVMSGGAALAAAPGNDLSGSPVVVGALPYYDTFDTSEATTDADDVQMNPPACGLPATEASVWFTFTASEDGLVGVDTIPSTYGAGVSVGLGTPGSLSWITCDHGITWFEVVSGQTYTILVFDDHIEGVGNGGTLELSLWLTPPPPDVEATVDPVGHFDAATGGASVSGTVLCDASAEYAYIDLELTQRVGRLLIRGFGGAEVTCTGEPEPWTAFVIGENGTFKGGKSVGVALAVACRFDDCGSYVTEQAVQLNGKRL